MEANHTKNTEKHSRRMKSPGNRGGQLLFGLTLLAFGVLMVLRNMGIIEGKLSQLLLPTLAIGLGAGSLIVRKRHHYVTGILLLVAGAWFLLPRFFPGIGWTPLWPSWLTFWPLVCILLGILALTHLLHPRCHARGCGGGEADAVSETQDGFVEVNNSFGSVRHIVLDSVFKGARIRTKFSGTVLDLRRTTLAEGDTFIDLDMSLSGLELHLPDDWTVIADPLTLTLAGIDDKRNYRVAPDLSRRLILRGDLYLSGIEIE